MKINRIIDTDSYKVSHYLQYPPETTRVFAYLESRGSERDYTETVFFGLQYILQNYFAEPITLDEINEANEIITAHGLTFNFNGWNRLIEKHGGRLPLKIRAVAEGLIVPLKNVLMTIENTDDEFFWLVSWFETQFMRVWYPITVATQSFNIKRDIYKSLSETSDDADAEILFKLHDFGSRGVSSQQSAAIGGAAHLLSFRGSDTMAALMLLRKFYHAPMAGFSIPAAEHSTITSWTRNGETDAYRNMLQQFASAGKTVAVVSDSWDIYNAVEKIWGETLRDEVVNSGATIVIRPDSGEPIEVISKIINILADKFGTVTNSKGFRVLKNVRIIQGDGVNESAIREILQSLKTQGFSASNIAFGMGGALLQKVNRDTLKFAYKCSAIVVKNELREVYKQPITDAGKISKKGKLDLIRDENGDYKTVKLESIEKVTAENSVLKTVFENGEVFADDDLETIRARMN
ncbi:MAG: nicotinate phosphoribosyltransferase [Pyrinomonadaceae bacterium]|nr:nicotinate phosphoribosyltransferase [Pyrinomonadaceae bacterium]